MILRSVDFVLSAITFLSRTPAVPTQPSRILVANCADFGDLVLVLPMLRALRGLFPEAHIGFLASRKSAAVLADVEIIDQLHVVDFRWVHIFQTTRFRRIPFEVLQLLSNRWRIIREMRQAGYDVALDTYLFPFPSSPLLYLAGIPVRCGFVSGGFGPLLTHPVEPDPLPRAILDRPRELLEALWPEAVRRLPPFEPWYPGHPKPRSDINAPAYWVVHMGTGAIYKEWPEEKWCVLLRVLADRKVQLLLTGSGPRERERIERVLAKLARPNIQSFVDRPWTDFVDIVAQAERVICLDSAIAHVAAAFRVPTTALFTGAHDLGEWRPANERCDVLMAPVGCAPCNRHDCVEMTCIREIEPADVLASLDRALAADI
jgi:ADP-heptose:LPS heptosyltransferase